MDQSNVRDFLEDLEASGFYLSVTGEQLLLKARRSKLTKDQVAAVKENKSITGYIRENKEEIIKHLVSLQRSLPVKNSENVAAIYRLSNLQEGMLFHGLYDPDGRTYLQQLSCRLNELRPDVFRRVWEGLVQRHTILRTGFYYENFNIPHQCVFRNVVLPFVMLDYRDKDAEAQEILIDDYKEADYGKGFDLTAPPLLRIALFRLAENDYHLLFTFHHIITDGWSIQVLFEEFFNGYWQIANGNNWLSPGEDKFEDYIRYIESRDRVQEEAYWRDYLKLVSSRCLLPFIGQTQERSKGLSRYDRIWLRIDKELTACIQGYANRNRVTINTVMQAAWSFLLSRYTGRSDVLFAVPVSGRPHDLAGVEKRVGLYINTLPFHAYVDADRSILEWLQQIQQEQLNSRDHQYAGLADIQKWISMPGDIFDTLLVFENFPVSKPATQEKEEMRIENLQFYDPTTYPLSLAITASEEISISFTYNVVLLQKEWVDVISAHFHQILKCWPGLEEDGEEKVRDIRLVPDIEMDKIMDEFNNTGHNYAYQGTIAGLFERQVAAHALSVAVVDGNRRMTYGELNARSNRLARRLRRLGIKEGTVVPVCIARSAELVVGILGILKAGAAYVPLDPAYPAVRLAYMLEDTESKIVVGDVISRRWLEELPDLQIVDPDGGQEIKAGEDVSDLTVSVSGDRLAYVIYTSGSTGRPKGVSMPEKGLVNLLLWHEGEYGKSRCQRVLQYASINFDASFQEIFSALCFGGGVIMIDHESRKDMRELLSVIEKEQVEDLFIPYVVLRDLCRFGVQENCYPGSLVRIYTAGEQLRLNDDIRNFCANTGLVLVNYYGPSETHVVSWYEVQEKDYEERSLPPIGRPISNTGLYILDGTGKVCGIGVEGEIYASGVQVATGYWRDPERTAQRFGTGLFPGVPEERWYRTGDKGRYLLDGNIEFLGRVDDQLKIRGNRVEPGEVEQVLLESGEVEQAVVLAQADAEGNKRLVGYVIGKQRMDKERVLRYMRSRVPDYLVPSVLVELEQFPVTVNGKVDKKSLPEAGEMDLVRKTYIEPGSEIEKALIGVWSDLLGVARISIKDNFFELGGHSLLAIRLVSAIRRKLDREIYIRDIFKYPTIDKLSSYLSNLPKGMAVPALTRHKRPERIPLSYAQERLWLVDRLEGSVAYHIPAMLRLTGEVNLGALHSAIREVVNRHETLRTVFLQEDGIPFIQILEKNQWDWEIADAEKLSPGDLIERPFDLSRDHMLKCWLLCQGEGEYLLVISLHHIASDGWSMPILVRELEHMYRSFSEGKTPELPPLEVQYADYAIWQRGWLTGEVLSQKLAYWTRQLKGLQRLYLPGDFVRGSRTGGRASLVTLQVDYATTESLRRLCQAQEVTLFMALLSMLKAMLYRYTGQRDICIGTAIAGRRHQEVEGLVGFFINMLALRTVLEGQYSFVQLLQKVRGSILDAYDNQDVPFEKVVEAMGWERNTDDNPLFNIMLVLQNNATAELEKEGIGGMKIRQESLLAHSSKMDISFTVTEYPGGLWIDVEYNRNLYEERTIQRLAGHYSELLRSVCLDATCSLDLLQMLPSEELHCLERFNDTTVCRSGARGLLDLFDVQVAAAPDAVALISGDEQLTYKELDLRSGQLANSLRRKGVCDGMPVPLCISRSMEMVIGILGILKAGGAYVAIDTEYPEERINYILKDVASGLLVTEKHFSEAFTAGGEVENVVRENRENPIICIVYTSGSSGNPKGAVIDEKGILNRLEWMWAKYPFEKDEKCALKTSLGFGDHIWELFGPLLKGIPSVVFRKEEIIDLDGFLQKMTSLGITRLVLVPSLLAAILERLRSGNIPLPFIRYWTCSGEVLDNELVQEFYRLFTPGVQRLFNIYGSTEVTADATYFETDAVGGSMYRTRVKNLIGKPIDNTRIHVIDNSGGLVPIGVPGELLVEGDGVVKGYLNQPELTAERFIIADMQGLKSGGRPVRTYRTGDIARWMEDGNIEYMGRMDNQIKIRGFRIEPGEVEAAIVKSGLARQTVVSVWSDYQGNHHLVGYVVPQSSFDQRKLRDILKRSLPSYMVPSMFVEMDNLPLNANGKLDRKQLPRPDLSGVLKSVYVPPGTVLEERLAVVWRALLSRERIGITDNFFESGGHSLLAARVAAAIRSRLGMELTIRDLFDYPTIRELAAYLENGPGMHSLAPISVGPRPDKVPLSFAQERLWFVDKLQGSRKYHMPWIWRVKGRLDLEALESSFFRIVQRHEILRTVIMEEEGISYQVVRQADGWTMQKWGIEELVKDQIPLEKKIEEVIRQPFDLSRDMMLRVAVICLADDEYMVVTVLHHIAFDGWSVGILAEELAELYRAGVVNRIPALAPVPVQYADYALWQRSRLMDMAAGIGYWQDKLRDISPLELTTDFARKEDQDEHEMIGKIIYRLLDQKTAEDLMAIARRQEATLFMVLLSLVKILLYRYTSQENICVGTPIAGRPRQELERSIGFFVNTLPLYSKLHPDMRFSELLAQIRSTTLDAYDHQEIPFERIVEAVATERLPGITPLFQVMFALQNTPVPSELDLGGARLASVPLGETPSRFDLSIHMTESVRGLHMTFVYRSDLFLETTMVQMMDHFEELIHAVIRNPEASIGTMRLLNSQEEDILLRRINTSQVSYPSDSTIISLFERQVEKTPQAIALVFEESSLTYKELDERATRLGNYLMGKGIGEEMLVPVCLERSAALIIAILGILKAGAVYVPLDPGFPADRLRWLLEDTGAGLMFGSRDSLAGTVGSDIDIILPDAGWQAETPLSESSFVRHTDPSCAIYVIYTSGSTGYPKGVIVEDRHLADHVYGLMEYADLRTCKTFALFASLSADAGHAIVFSCLLTGGTLHVLSDRTLTDAEALSEYINKNEIDCIKIVPSLWLFYSERNEGTPILAKKVMLFGGETLSPDVVHRLDRLGYNGAIYNHYGPTEATIGKCIYRIAARPSYDKIPIGVPFSNTRLYILDERGNPVPFGVPGELIIAGEGVARGYLNRPELTAARFPCEPFRDMPENRAYKTGDRARWLPDGTISYLGRMDEQLKIRGYRIEPAEIERVMVAGGSARQAIVVIKKDDKNQDQLVGYFTGNGLADQQLLFEYLGTRLPAYMIPSRLIWLETMPLLSNGKIDKKSLPDPGEADLPHVTFRRSRNPTEIQLTRIWQLLLHLPAIGIDDNFFRLGGHSLLAMRMVAAIRKDLKTDISVRDIFVYPTIVQLSDRIREHSGEVQLPAIGSFARPQLIPLSYAQERLWFIDALEGSVRYHIPMVLKLRGRLNREALRYALRGIVNRHEVLRTVFKHDDGTAFQQILAKDKWELEFVGIDLQSTDRALLQPAIEERMTRPFDLSKDHMFRASLFELGEDEWMLAVVMHHIASDGWSRPLMIRELDTLYRSFLAGERSSPRVLPIQYADFAIWQRECIQGDLLEQKLAYWRRQLRDAPVLNLVPDYPRPALPGISGDKVQWTIGKELTSRLYLLGHEENATIFMTLMSAMYVLLFRYSGQTDICIGSPIAGRQYQEVEDLIGFFLNTLALRNQLDGDPSFGEVLQRVKETTLQAYDNQEAPFEKVVEAVVKERDPSRNPLFQVMFQFEEEHSSANQVEESDPQGIPGDLLISWVDLPLTTAKFDLCFSVSRNSGTLGLEIDYCTDLYRRDTIQHMAEHYQQILESVVNDRNCRISQLPMLTQQEELLLKVNFNDTAVDYPKHKTVIDLFEEQVARSPDAPAVISGDATMITYEELDTRSNKLSWYLQQKGVKEQDLVPICVGRAAEVIIGILGILKAGAVYVPVDPDYPAGRIATILKDINATVIVTTSDSAVNIEKKWQDAQVRLNTEWDEIERMPAYKIGLRTVPQSLIYLIYTSGSTGIPKGAGVYHHSFTSLVQWYIREFSIDAQDKNLIISSIGFDLTQKNFFSTLAAGGTLVFPSMSYYDFQIILQEVREQRITLINCAPSAFYPLVESKTSFKDLASVRLVVLGGEPILSRRLAAWRQNSKAEIVNSYGPTECADISSFYRLDDQDFYEHRSIPIGRPNDNVKLYVLGDYNQLQPVGVPGELCVTGESVGIGYINDVMLTAAKFIPNPFGSGCLYRTGDLCRWRPDGNIEYMGRMDNQVKIRGNRVELGEVESVLSRCPGVRECAAVAWDIGSDRQLMAYVVGEKQLDRKRILSFMRGLLPEYMIPGELVQLDRIPLNGNGKVDRKNLPLPTHIATGSVSSDETYGERERPVVNAWEQVLHRKEIGINDNFFDIGGNSLRIVALSSRLTDILGQEISVLNLFQYPTIKKLLTWLDERSAAVYPDQELQEDQHSDREEILTELRKFDI